MVPTPHTPLYPVTATTMQWRSFTSIPNQQDLRCPSKLVVLWTREAALDKSSMGLWSPVEVLWPLARALGKYMMKMRGGCAPENFVMAEECESLGAAGPTLT